MQVPDPRPGASGDPADHATALIHWLASRDGARFVADARSALAVSEQELETALGRLEAEGRVVVQHNFCADPHFADDDLRIVALVSTDGDDPRAAAAHACERRWQRWMAEFLASHRCT